MAFVRTNHEEPWQMYVVNADGSGPRRVIDGDFIPTQDQPSWSPDGKRLVYSRFTGPPNAQWPVGTRMRVFIASLVDGVTRQLIPEAQSPVIADYWDHQVVWSRASR